MNTQLRKAYRFFFEHAGYIVGERAKCAFALARAEQQASEQGIEYVIQGDDYPDASFVETWAEREQEEWRKHDHECICVSAVMPCPDHGTDCKHAECLASLGGLWDADNAYLRVVKAELALEALMGRE